MGGCRGNRHGQHQQRQRKGNQPAGVRPASPPNRHHLPPRVNKPVTYLRMGRPGGPGNGTGVMAAGSVVPIAVPRALRSSVCKGHRKASDRTRPHRTAEVRRGCLRRDQRGGSHIGRCTRAPVRVRGCRQQRSARRLGPSGPHRAPIGPTGEAVRSRKLGANRLRVFRSTNSTRSAFGARPGTQVP